MGATLSRHTENWGELGAKRNEAKNKSGQKAVNPARHPPPRSGLVQLLSDPH
jgi:hypothetical protein